jgi:hypothetical protein
MNRTRLVVAIAVSSIACVNVPDSIKGTFAPRQGSEVDNFSPNAPHSMAPPELTQATVPISQDGSAATTSATLLDAGGVEMICPRDPMPASPTTSSANCMQDAGKS